MSEQSPPPHWLNQPISELFDNMQASNASNNTPDEAADVEKQIQVTFGIHIWQKGSQNDELILFANDNGTPNIPGRVIVRAPGDIAIQNTIREEIEHILKKPIEAGEIRDVQFLDLIDPAGLKITDDDDTHHMGIPIMISADVDLHADINLYSDAGHLKRPFVCTYAQIDDIRERSETKGDLKWAFERRRKLQDLEAKENEAKEIEAAREGQEQQDADLLLNAIKSPEERDAEAASFSDEEGGSDEQRDECVEDDAEQEEQEGEPDESKEIFELFKNKLTIALGKHNSEANEEGEAEPEHRVHETEELNSEEPNGEEQEEGHDGEVEYLQEADDAEGEEQNGWKDEEGSKKGVKGSSTKNKKGKRKGKKGSKKGKKKW